MSADLAASIRSTEEEARAGQRAINEAMAEVDFPRRASSTQPSRDEEDQMARAKMEGEQVVEINYEEVYNLVGRLLTLNDASAPDKVRRDAQKTLIKQTVYGWIDDVAWAQGFTDWGNRGVHDGQAYIGPKITLDQKQKDQNVTAVA